MNGKIAYKSRVGEGTTFTVTFPCVKASAHEPEEGLSGVFPPHDEKRVVPSEALALLYVEDDHFNRQLFKAVISPYANLTLHMAKNGCEGIEMVRELKPDIVFMDIGLPDMSGYDAFKMLQKDADTSEIPVVGLSASAMPVDIAKAKQMGFIDYLTKPFAIGDLIQVIATIVEARKTI